MTKKTSTSQEDYLEAILMQINEKGACRITDIARQLGYSKPSVSIAVTKLEEDGFVIRDEWRIILTPKGDEIARTMLSRHNFFAEWFIRMGIDPQIAISEACKLEHSVSEKTYNKIVEYIRKSDDKPE